MNNQREVIKAALITGLYLRKTVELRRAITLDIDLPLPINQINVESYYMGLIGNIKRTPSKMLRLDGTVDKRRQKRFGLKGRYIKVFSDGGQRLCD